MLQTVFVLEDDQDLREYLKELLLDNGYAVQDFADGVSILKAIKRTQPDLIILDLGLPDISGETVCTDIKKLYPDIPIVILTARDSVSDVVRGLDIGADDYMTKPFAGEELVARIKARLRQGENHESKLKAGDLELDNETLEVRRANKVISLTQTEFQLLQYLLSNKGRVLTREMILNRVWAYSSDIESRVVDVYVGYLRKKIDSTYDKKLIQSVRGFGYMIKD
jgi:two-component system OmpR family response regulator